MCYDGGGLSYQNASEPPATPTAPISVSDTKSESDAQPTEFVAYSDWGFDVKIVPASGSREWMDKFDNGFAYHCLPMKMANQAGWFILAPHAITAEWNGGPRADDLTIEVEGSPQEVGAVSHVGDGILTWLIPYVFRTPGGWNLLCRGPANHVKDGLCPLEGLVETDWSVVSFSMNWKFTRPCRCRFEAEEPIAMLVPYRRGDLELFEPRLAELRENPELKRGYDSWVESRWEFWEQQKDSASVVPHKRFQKHYARGCRNDGVFFEGHQRALRVRPFEAPATGENRAPEQK